MTDYLSTLTLSCAVVSLASLLAPEGKSRKYVLFVLSLVAFLVMAAPIFSLRENAEGLKNDLLLDTEWGEIQAEDAVVEAYEGAVRDGLAQALSLPQESIEVDIMASFEGGSCEIESIWIKIDRSFDDKAAKAYLDRTLPPDCEVILFGG